MTDSTDLKLNRFVPYLLSVLSNEISQNIAHQYEQEFGIDMHQWRVMAILGEYTALSAMEVGEHTAMDKVAVSRAVKKMLDQQLVVREFAESDKRRSIVSLSQSGLAMYQQIIPIAKNYEKVLLNGFNSSELDQLFSLLKKLKQSNAKLNIATD